MSLPPSYNLLKQYPNPVFCETGIWRGDSIQQAIEAGFPNIIGLDNDQTAIDFCKQRFADVKPSDLIGLYLADTAYGLWGTIQFIKEPTTFFLDAHWQLIEGTDPGENPFPLMNELLQIRAHDIKTHTIIIDDLLYLTHPKITGWTLNEIKEAICRINIAYEFEEIANPVINNMLVAWIP